MIVTARLQGLPLAESDLDDLIPLHRDDRVLRAFGAEPATDEETRAFLQRKLGHWEENGFGIWMFRAEDGSFVGRCGIHQWRGEVELGYIVLPALWGQGYATEMAHAVATHGFRVLGLGELVAFTKPDNVASRRVMEKVGFRYERDFVEDEERHVLYRLAPRASRVADNAAATQASFLNAGLGESLPPRPRSGSRPTSAVRRSRVIRMAAPTLVVVSGPPGAGKTRLAHHLARAIACPAVCRDEIKEGMVHAEPGDFRPEAGDPLTVRAFETFFDVLRMMVTAGVTVVAEAAFQNRLWRAGLEPLTDLAQLRVVQCTVDAATARARIASRRAAAEPGRAAHAEILDLDSIEESIAAFERISISAPSIVVDTTDGYSPGLAEIVEFVNRP